MTEGDRFVTIATISDPVQAEMWRDVLAQEGIEATIAGAMHASLYGGFGQALMGIKLQVPASRAAEAQEILESLRDEESVVVDGSIEAAALEFEEDEGPAGREAGAGPYRSPPKRRPVERPRLKRVAAFLSLAITFGTGHLYARETVAGVLLLLAELAVFGLGMEEPTFMLALPGLMLIDLVGSWRAVKRHNAGAPLGGVAQLLRASALIGLVVVAARVGWPALEARLAPPEAEAAGPAVR